MNIYRKAIMSMRPQVCLEFELLGLMMENILLVKKENEILLGSGYVIVSSEIFQT